MPTNERPATMKKAVEQLWDDVRGTNDSGLVTLARKNRDDITEMKADVSFIKGRLEGHVGTEKPSMKTITIRHLLEVGAVALVVGVCILGAGLLVAGKLTPDDIVRILEAWKGSP